MHFKPNHRQFNFQTIFWSYLISTYMQILISSTYIILVRYMSWTDKKRKTNYLKNLIYLYCRNAIGMFDFQIDNTESHILFLWSICDISSINWHLKMTIKLESNKFQEFSILFLYWILDLITLFSISGKKNTHHWTASSTLKTHRFQNLA